jgi:hypothetical protein
MKKKKKKKQTQTQTNEQTTSKQTNEINNNNKITDEHLHCIPTAGAPLCPGDVLQHDECELAHVVRHFTRSAQLLDVNEKQHNQANTK